MKEVDDLGIGGGLILFNTFYQKGGGGGNFNLILFSKNMFPLGLQTVKLVGRLSAMT